MLVCGLADFWVFAFCCWFLMRDCLIVLFSFFVCLYVFVVVSVYYSLTCYVGLCLVVSCLAFETDCLLL